MENANGEIVLCQLNFQQKKYKTPSAQRRFERRKQAAISRATNKLHQEKPPVDTVENGRFNAVLRAISLEETSRDQQSKREYQVLIPLMSKMDTTFWHTPTPIDGIPKVKSWKNDPRYTGAVISLESMIATTKSNFEIMSPIVQGIIQLPEIVEYGKDATKINYRERMLF